MKKGKNMGKKGFTIIEVVLVLAIAGLIFLMVFVALPSLQRQQRNAQREEDIADLISAIKKYQTNNRGALPDGNGEITYGVSSNGRDWGKFMSDYLDKNKFVDPLSGNNYKLKVGTCSNVSVNDPCEDNDTKDAVSTSTTFPNENKIYVIRQAKCAGDETIGAVASPNPRRIAVMYKLEGNWLYCAES